MGSLTLAGDKITEKQMRFVNAYVRLKSVRGAAKECGIHHHNALSLMKYAHVRKEIRRKIQDEFDSANVTPDAVIAELARVAFVDPADYFGDNGELLSIKKMPVHVRKTIDSIKVRRELAGSGDDKREVEVVEIKRVPKIQALDKLARYHSLLVDKVEVEHTVNDELETLMREAQSRLEKESDIVKVINPGEE